VSFRKILHWLRQIDAWLLVPAILFVVWGELQPATGVEVNVWDKALHFVAYFGLALMATIAVRADRRALWWAAGLVLMGGSLEIVQGLVGRDADILDEFANTLGVLTGLGLGTLGIHILKSLRLVERSGRD
jgi:VanZ family protein